MRRTITRNEGGHLPRKTWRRNVVAANRRPGTGSWCLRRMSSNRVSTRSTVPSRPRPNLRNGKSNEIKREEKHLGAHTTESNDIV